MASMLPSPADVISASSHRQFNGLSHHIHIDARNFDGAFGCSHHRDGQRATEVLSESLDAFQKPVLVAHGITPERKPEGLQAVRDTLYK